MVEGEFWGRGFEFLSLLILDGEVRCNNVLWISGAKGVKGEDTTMEG